MNDLTPEERKEVERLHGVLSDRARSSNSIISSMEISGMRHRGELDQMRFTAKFWISPVQITTVNTAYEVAHDLNPEPLEYVTDDIINALQRFSHHMEENNSYVDYSEKTEMLSGLAELLMKHRHREAFISSLVLDRSITDPKEVSRMLESAEDMPTPLTDGSL